MTNLRWGNAMSYQKPLLLFTQAELAKELGVSIQRVHTWTKGCEPRPAIKRKLMELYRQMPENEIQLRKDMMNIKEEGEQI